MEENLRVHSRGWNERRADCFVFFFLTSRADDNVKRKYSRVIYEGNVVAKIATKLYDFVTKL